MADFGIKATDLSAPQGAGANPISGATRTPTQYTLPSGLANIGVQVVEDLRKGEIAKKKEEAEAEKNRFIGSYIDEVNRITIDGRNGGLSPSEINARVRAVGAEYSSAAARMGIIEDLDKARKANLGISESGAVESEAEKLEAKRIKDRDFLLARGHYVPPDAPDSYVESLLMKATNSELYQRNYAQTAKEIDDARSANLYTQGQADRAQKEAAVKLITSYAGEQFASVQEQTTLIADRVASGAMSVDDGQKMLNESRARANAVLTQMSASNPELAAPYKTLFNQIHDLQEKRLVEPSKAIDEQIKTLLNKAKLTALQNDPEVVSLTVMSDLLGNTITGTLTANQLSAKILPKLVMTDTSSTNAVPNVIGSSSEKATETTLYSTAKQGLSMARSGRGTNPEQLKKEAFQLTNNILDQIGDKYGDRKLKASDLKEMTAFLSDPDFAYFVKEGGLNPTHAATAKRAYQQLYAQEVDNSIKNKLEQVIPVGSRERLLNEKATARGEAPAIPEQRIMDLVDITFSNGGVQFTAKPEDRSSRDMRGSIIQDKIRELKSTQTALTQAVRIGAHLEGTTDYQAYWEKNKATILPYYYGNDQYPIGVVVKGFKLKAYPYTDRNNWEKVDGKSE